LGEVPGFGKSGHKCQALNCSVPTSYIAAQ